MLLRQVLFVQRFWRRLSGLGRIPQSPWRVCCLCGGWGSLLTLPVALNFVWIRPPRLVCASALTKDTVLDREPQTRCDGLPSGWQYSCRPVPSL